MEVLWWVKMLIYFLSIALVSVVLLSVDWKKLVRKSHTSYGIILYIILTLVFGYCIGSLIIEFLKLSSNH